MCKFYISALVGVIIEYLDSMHGVTMRIAHVNFIENSFPFFFVAMFVVCTALCCGWQKWPVLAIPKGKDLAEDPHREDQRESEFDIGCDERERTNQHAAYWSS